MLSKEDYIDALLKLGFVREPASRTDGSHIRFHNSKYNNLYTGITDHKNTKEMNRLVHKDLIKTMSTYIWLETRNENNNIDFKKAKEMLKKIDEELSRTIIKVLKKADGKDVINIIPQRLHDEVAKVYDSVSTKEVCLYIQ